MGRKYFTEGLMYLLLLIFCFTMLAILFYICETEKAARIDLNKNKNIQYRDTPEYYRNYLKTTVLHK